MKHGFIKAAAVTPNIKVADTKHNGEEICRLLEEAYEKGADLIVMPELCITGYSCGDLFFQELLLREAQNTLVKIAGYTKNRRGLVFAGLPVVYNNKLYNAAAGICNGQILGLVPKVHIPGYNEFYETRHFARGMKTPVQVDIQGYGQVPMGTDILFICDQMPELKVAAELCEDVWAPDPPSVDHALAGATVIVNLSASDETTGKDIYRKNLITGQSARLVCGYVYASAGDGESTQDVVYSAHNIIAENGTLLAEAKRFQNESIYTEIDIQRLAEERRRMTTFGMSEKCYTEITFSLPVHDTRLSRFVDPMPFVPGRKDQRDKRCEEILAIQSMGLKKRLEHTGCSGVVVGISGGLDSTLALLVTARSFDLCNKSRKNIIAVTMPGFGTTDRTYDNAVNLISCLGAEFMEVSIRDAVNVHFKDIGQDPLVHDVTYENCQARERTQILMDIANKTGGLVIGTGDLSELALGWATYNGDHMSMYGVNASVPKTLVRHLVGYYADTCEDPRLSKVLEDILNTPVSPELLPPKDGKISQKTEDLVGPYELHDFFLYHVLRFGCVPSKIYRLAVYAFQGKYDKETILKWLKTFYRRFFAQQFKRSCLPDGPKVGTVAVSPRGDLRMPSDACARIWLDELEQIRL